MARQSVQDSWDRTVRTGQLGQETVKNKINSNSASQKPEMLMLWKVKKLLLRMSSLYLCLLQCAKVPGEIREISRNKDQSTLSCLPDG